MLHGGGSTVHRMSLLGVRRCGATALVAPVASFTVSTTSPLQQCKNIQLQAEPSTPKQAVAQGCACLYRDAINHPTPARR